MNAGMQDQLLTMSKFLALGESLEDVVAQSTWNPAREIKREELGHLTVGAAADLAVLSMARGDFGFVDSFGALQKGDRKLVCEMTFKDGLLAWDLNGRTREDWRNLPLDYGRQGSPRWDGITSTCLSTEADLPLTESEPRTNDSVGRRRIILRLQTAIVCWTPSAGRSRALPRIESTAGTGRALLVVSIGFPNGNVSRTACADRLNVYQPSTHQRHKLWSQVTLRIRDL